MFSPFELPLRTSRFLGNLRGATIDLIANPFSVCILFYSVLTLFCPKIAAISIDNGFLACQQFRGHGDIVLIGSSHFYSVDNTAVLVHTNMSLIAEMPCVSLFHLMCIRVTLLLFIFCGTRGRNDCGIYDRSFFKIIPRSISSDTTCANNFSCKLFFTSRLRKRPKVSPSGT